MRWTLRGGLIRTFAGNHCKVALHQSGGGGTVFAYEVLSLKTGRRMAGASHRGTHGRSYAMQACRRAVKHWDQLFREAHEEKKTQGLTPTADK